MEEKTPSVTGQGGWAPPSGGNPGTWAPPGGTLPAGAVPGAVQPGSMQPSAMPTAGAGAGAWAPPGGAPVVAPPPVPGQGGWAPPGAAPPPENTTTFAPPTGNTPLANTPLAGTPLANTPLVTSGPTIIDTSGKKSDGLNRCPKCGATEISTQPGTGMLICNYCRAVFELGQKEGPADERLLVGERIGSGAANITRPDDTHITIKCQGCGSEVVVNINESMTARCHWCRHVLSIETQIPNGAVPDLVLPFLLSKEQAQFRIEEFVKKRKFFAHPRFRKEFSTENILGVYLPYLVVDAKVHSDMRGLAGHIVRSYTVGSGKNQQRVYDIDVYNIGRNFDLLIDDLTVEASAEKRDVRGSDNTNNIINTILPFDIQNAVPYSGNYLKGFTSQRRDTSIDEVRGLVYAQIADIARFQAGATASAYDAGIVWEQEKTEASGMLWKAAYLPVWLYSYYEKKSNGKNILHYVAVNARTGETMGSVPMNTTRLLTISAFIELAALVLTGGFILLLLL